MKAPSTVFLKYCVIIVLFYFILFLSVGRCQDEDEDDEDTYDEELGDGETTTTTRRPRRTSTTSATASGQTETSANRNSTRRTGAEATTRASVPASAQAPTRATVRTTTYSEYEDDEATTEEEGYGYVFRPLNNLIENIVAGNVTGIVDNALSIRTPPEIRAFVNNVMNNVFGAGIGKALQQFMPNLFTTQVPPTQQPGRDPIPTTSPIQAVIPQPIPITAVLTARTNGTEEVNKAAKQKQPLQIALAHPGAPASRLRCEVIA